MSAKTRPPLAVVPARPTIVVGPDEARVIDEAVAALARSPEVYARGGELVEVVTDEPAARGIARSGAIARIVRCPEARVRELIAREADWTSGDGGGGQRRIHPPQWTVRGVIARGTWPGVRPIVAVVEAPTMRPDGTLITTAGYDHATGIYLAPSIAVRVSDQPTHEEARRAIATLLDLVCDFDFSSAAGRSAWLAGVLTVAARPAIDGPTPMIIIDASVRGAGKSLAVDTASLITNGRPAARSIYVHDDAEIRKRITSVLLVGDPLVLFDNVTGELGCPSLDAALTGLTWRDRVLGASTLTAELPLRTVWFATGNGLTVGADLLRRALLVRLEPRVEHPEERNAFKYPRLLDHVRTRRAELLAAALTIVRAYVAAGRPPIQLTPMGSYEGWSDLVRAAIVWAGEPDPCGTVADLRAADVRADAFRAVVESWPADPGESITAAALLERAVAGSPWRVALVDWCGPKGDAPLPTPKALGYALRAVRRRVVAGRMLDAAPRGKQGAQWVLTEIGGQP